MALSIDLEEEFPADIVKGEHPVPGGYGTQMFLSMSHTAWKDSNFQVGQELVIDNKTFLLAQVAAKFIEKEGDFDQIKVQTIELIVFNPWENRTGKTSTGFN